MKPRWFLLVAVLRAACGGDGGTTTPQTIDSRPLRQIVQERGLHIGVFPGQGEALIFDAGFGKKPAYYAVQAVLAGR